MALSNVVNYRNAATSFRGLFDLVIELECTWDPDNILSNSFFQEDITVNGAALGDICLASFEGDLQNINFSAHVKSANTVSLHLINNTAGAVNLAAAQVHLIVSRPYHRHA